MNNPKLVITIIALCLIESGFALECTLIGHNCTFSGVRTTEAAPLFHPYASDNYTVEIVEFTDSVIPVLTNELCKVFPNLKELWADKLSLEKIHPDALHDCEQLVYVSFWTNKLKGVDSHVFDENLELETISFQLNFLNDIDGKLFHHNKKLHRLCLAENSLVKLSLESFPILEHLEELFLQMNYLTDLDDQELMRKFKNLKDIYIQNNMFDCDRLQVILDGLHKDNVEVKEVEHVNLRNTNLNHLDNVECVLAK